MVSQKMGFQRGGGNSSISGTGGGTRVETEDPNSDPLARQGSMYNLTFAEMENQLGDLGKPLSSMNLDELLKTLFAAETNNNSKYNHLVGDGDSGPSGQQRVQPASLDQQSSIALSRDLSKKTVDEVWHDIQQDQKRNRLDRKATLGEITLEDFLFKAGIVAREKNTGSLIGGVDPIGLSQQAAQWMNYPIPQPSMMPVFGPGHMIQHAIPIGGNIVVESGGYSDNQITMSSSPIMGTLSDTQTSRRKRAGPTDIVEKSVERRQKRMIKNRESAARSRARKQAYTNDLEYKVSRLKEENKRLKRQQELEKVLPSVPPPEPRYQLRRTSSAPM
ncbi:ABSCISIC ACID-INSENSITIVE 5-like protein 2 [Orobanche gracilis]